MSPVSQEILCSLVEATKACLPRRTEVRFAFIDPDGFEALEDAGEPLYGFDSRGRLGIWVPAPAFMLFDTPFWRADQVLVVAHPNLRPGEMHLYRQEPQA